MPAMLLSNVSEKKPVLMLFIITTNLNDNKKTPVNSRESIYSREDRNGSVILQLLQIRKKLSDRGN